MPEIWQCPDCDTAITYNPADQGSVDWSNGFVAGHERGHTVHGVTGHNPRVPSRPIAPQPKGDNG